MTSTHIVEQELLVGMAMLQTSGEYSDLVVTCGNKVFKLHRAIVCPRSRFFDAACKGNFKEAMTGKIELKEDDPELIQHLIDYLYTLNYDDGLGAIERGPGGEKVPAFFLEHYACKLALKMHVLADKYSIQGLRELATAKLEDIVMNLEFGSWKAENFISIADQVYEKTCLVDQMREVIAARAIRDLDKLICPSFHELIAKEPEFSVDVLTGCSRLVKSYRELQSQIREARNLPGNYGQYPYQG